MDNKIIRDFQACLNKARKEGRLHDKYQNPNIKILIECGKVCFTLPNWEKQFTLAEVLFGPDSGFLDMIEWKQKGYSRYQYSEYGERDLGGIEDDDKQYHKMQLSLLESDELRMKRVLDNMKGFIAKR